MRLERGEIAAATASLGTWTFTILLALYAYYEDGAGAVGLAVVVRLLPAALVAPVVARLARDHSRRTVLLASALAGFALMEAIALVVSLDVSFAAVLGLAAFFNIGTSPYRPAQPALLGRGVLDYAGLAAGALAAAVLATVSGLGTCFAVCGVAFLAVAAIALTLPSDSAGAVEPDGEHEPAGAEPRWLLGLFAGGALVQSMLEVLLVIAALELLGMNQGGVGWLRAAAAAGGLIVCAAVVRRLGGVSLASRVAAGWAFAGVTLGMVAAVRDPAPALILLVLVGGGYAIAETGLMALTRGRGRAGAAHELTYAGARALGAMLAAWLAVQLGDQQALVTTALLLPALALAAFYSLHAADAAAGPEAAPGAPGGLPLARE